MTRDEVLILISSLILRLGHVQIEKDNNSHVSFVNMFNFLGLIPWWVKLELYSLERM